MSLSLLAGRTVKPEFDFVDGMMNTRSNLNLKYKEGFVKILWKWSRDEHTIGLYRCETSSSPSVKVFYWPFQGGASFVEHFSYLCFVFVLFSRLFIAAMWSPAG